MGAPHQCSHVHKTYPYSTMVPDLIAELRTKIEKLQGDLSLLEDLHRIIYGKPYTSVEEAMLMDAVKVVEDLIN